MKKMRLLALLALALLANVSFAQNVRVSGVVTDISGAPLIGVVVSVSGTSTASATDVDGVYTLQNVPSNGTLQFRYAGMKSMDEPVNGRTTIDLQMQEDAVQAEAVVVTALGVKRPTKALGYAVQEVSGQKLLETRSVNVSNALTGQIAGLQIVKGGGGPGASSKILLRGQNSLSGSNQPLIVVDGVPIDNFSGNGSTEVWGNQGSDMGSGLNDINPEDIEAMTVLKGPSAAALYGSRAGNGVILITTKSGRTNPGLGITISGGVSIENILVKPELQNSFGQGLNGTFDNQALSSWGPAANVGNRGLVWNKELEGFADGEINTYDNIGSFFRTGVIDNQSITFQQQVKKTSVYASVNRMNDESMIPETNLNRTSVTARATTNLGEDDRWKLDVKINYINSNAKNRPTQGINASNTFYVMNTLPRSINIADFNPSLSSKNGRSLWWNTSDGTQENPWWTLQHNQNTDTRDRFIGFMSLAYKFTDWLSLEVKGGMDFYSTRTENKRHSTGNRVPEGSYSVGESSFMEANYSFLLVAQKDNIFGKFGGAFTFGGNMMTQRRSGLSSNVEQLLIPDVFSLGNGRKQASVSREFMQRSMNSLYGSLALNWNRAVFLEATLRNDWSSTMSKANMSYMYPSISTSVVISDLVNAMPSWFDFAKVRASYAEVGNDLDPYQLYTTYGTSLDMWDHPQAWRGDVLFDPTVRSELVKSWEVGFEVRFLDSRLRLDAAWYKSNSTRQLIQIPLDASTGYKSKMINAGNIQNEGIEVSLGASIFRNPDGFSWDAGINLAHNRNTIVEIVANDPTFRYSLGGMEDISVIAAQKNDIDMNQGLYGEIYGSKFTRVEDVNSEFFGQLLLDDKGRVQATKGQYLGCQQPDAIIGFNNSLKWKGINLDINFDARIGGKMFSFTQAQLQRSGNAAVTAPGGLRNDMVVDGVIKQADGSYVKNTNTVTMQEYYRDQLGSLGSQNIGITEANLYDATSVRLRTLSLGYALPQKVLANSGFQRVKFSVTANNLWLIYSAVPGIDPEAVSATGSNVTALEIGVPPTTRTFTFNLTLGF